MQAIDLIGQIFGRLTVAERVGSDAKGRAVFSCRCECSRRVIVSGKSLRAGNTSSCGCLQRERSKAASAKKNTRHGLTHTAIYEVWCGMRKRCQDPTHQSFNDYGGRGIKVCPRWGSFDAFHADMAPRPPGLTLDRIDNDGDYEPGNCRWATLVEQARNRRSNRLLTAFGETKLAVEWVEDSRCPVSMNALSKRLAAGWTDERAVSGPRRGVAA